MCLTNDWAMLTTSVAYLKAFPNAQVPELNLGPVNILERSNKEMVQRANESSACDNERRWSSFTAAGPTMGRQHVFANCVISALRKTRSATSDTQNHVHDYEDDEYH